MMKIRAGLSALGSMALLLAALGFFAAPAEAASGFVRVNYLGNQKAKIEAYTCVSAAIGFGNAVDVRFTKELTGRGVVDFVINDGCGGRWTKAKVSVWNGGREGGYRVVQENIEFESRDVNAQIYITGPFADKRAPAANWFAAYSSAGLAQGALAARFAQQKSFTVYNKTTSTMSCPSPAQCGSAGPALRVEVKNCGKATATHANIAGRFGSKTFTVSDTCGSWASLRLTMEYFGNREVCAEPVDTESQRVVYVWGPYEREWTHAKGVFECTTSSSAGTATRVKNGRVDFYNGGSLPTWFGYRPNGCKPDGGSWLAIGPGGRGLAGAEAATQYYSIYNHDCGQYSRFWFEYGNDSSWCPPRGIKGNHEFIRYGGYEPGWCEVHGKSFDGY